MPRAYTTEGVLGALVDGVIILDPERRIVEANPAARRILGLARAEGIGASAESALAPWPALLALVRGKEGSSAEAAVGDGPDRREYEVGVAAMGSPAAGLVMTWHDVTRHRRAETELTRERQHLESLHATTLEVMDRLELDSLLDALVARATDLLRAPSGFLYLENAEASALDCRVWVGSKPRDPVAGRNEGAVGHVWVSGAPLVVPDYDRWAGRSPQVPGGVFGAMAAVPLRMGGRVAGALGVAHEAGSARSFGQAEERMLSGFAQLASLALENARLYASAQRSEERYRGLVQNSLGLHCAHDLDGVLLVVNAAASQALGYAIEEMVGHNLREFLPSPVHPLFDEYLARMRRDGISEGVMRIATRSGEDRLWRYRNILRQEAGQRPYVIGFALDETDRVRAREELRRTEQLREDLTHTMVHDLRGPLTWVLGSLEVLESGLGDGPSSRNRELLSKARGGAGRILHLVNSILDVARLERGELPLERQEVEMGAIVSEAIGLASPLAAEKRVALIQEPSPGAAAWADPHLLARVVQNLLGNAIKFTPEGGSVRVRADRDASGVRVTVSDTGPGVAEEVRPRLFQKFASGRSQPHGSGLGLAFCRLAVEAHGGKIRSEHPPEGGARFVFTLPAAP